ncbi:MAG: Holliday junction resolvase RuvX [Candidatus Pacebacteria bacterium]|nr:Holliday junction resolvase RuvX [Candidatus Paceibacterota bacterium]
MTKLMGIDFGTKRVGVALSDETSQYAFPHAVIENIGMTRVVDEIVKICQAENVSQIVLGESRGFDGKENDIMKKVHKFKSELQSKLSVPIVLEPEFMTSAEAGRLQGSRSDLLDASAAALILKSYIDKNK